MGKLWRWIKSLFVRGGYRCDMCGKWRSRVDGKATPHIITKELPPVGQLPAMYQDIVELVCPSCQKGL